MLLPFSASVPAPRRQFLVGSGLATALGQLPAWARLGERPAHNPFTLGVASGDPEPDNVLLWTRLTPPLAQLGDLAADLGLHAVAEQAARLARGVIGLGGEGDVGLALA
ncbi:PhoD-like phosphatase N-terminal domain-containing protein, partial [Burkholderia sola]|uniref:PhoD-like phosphatase N-terminal domain-containing protein n=1 Tax=Burkholderia sola TaxID=2843302 RepID=UPI00339035A7